MSPRKKTDWMFEDADLVFVPLGGSGEIGMNLNCYGYKGDWIICDIGMSFAGDEYPGVELIVPDPSFIAARAKKLKGIVITHGHEDHIGAAAHLWPELRCPIYTTAFTAELLWSKFEEAGIDDEVEIIVVPAGGEIDLGPFHIRFVALPHSIAEMNALVIETPAGKLFHTGDWKMDDEPIISAPACAETLTKIGEEGVLALIGDSTNVFVERNSGSEKSVHDGLLPIVRKAKGRVIVTTFASNVARLHTVGVVAKETGRHLVAIGRSMDRVIAAAKATGYLKDFPPLLNLRDADDVPANKLIVLCTGCQGEPRAALTRMANGEHKDLKLHAGDTVIFSSRLIPGNEPTVGRLINTLVRNEVKVITDRDAPVHVSGHPGRADLRELYGWLKPAAVIPVHGEERHMRAHRELAIELGVKQTALVRNGSVLRLAPGKIEVIGQVEAGRLLIDGLHLIEEDDEAILERRRMLWNGTLVIVALLTKKGNLAALDIIAKGLFDMKPGDEIHDDLQELLTKHIQQATKGGNFSAAGIAEDLRITARRYIRNHHARNPVTEARVLVAG